MAAAISVIIPVYNGEKYIQTIMESLKSQTFQGFEVVFVNDGSADGSEAAIRRHIEGEGEKYRLISQPNAGVSAARNAGLIQARGEYIAFVDVDDQLDPLYFEYLYRYTEGRDDRVAVVGQAHELTPFTAGAAAVKERAGVPLLEDFLYGRVRTGIWGMLIPRALLDGHDLRFKSGYKYSEDLHMVWRVFCFAKTVVFIDAPLYIYREIPGSAMTAMNRSRLDSLYLIRELEGFFDAEKPDFAPAFRHYAVARMTWSLLWQAAHYLDYKKFREFLEIYDFRSDIKKLVSFPEARVRLSSACFLVSARAYHAVVRAMTRRYRINER